MKKILKYIYIVMIIAGITGMISSCRDDFADYLREDTGVRFTADGNMLLPVALQIPGMTSAGTRALDETPDYANLKLYLLVFEEGSGLRQYRRLETEYGKQDSKHNHNNLVEVAYEIELEPTQRNAVIHLIATNQPDFDKTITFGTEERVMSSLYTDGGSEAYWQRLDPGCHIPSADSADPTSPNFKEEDALNVQTIAGMLNHVPMIRNFCRVSVNALGAQNFVLTGLYVLNTIDRGSVAPYVAENPTGSRFVKYYDETGTGFTGKKYEDILAQNYVGFIPQGALLENTTYSPESVQTKSESTAGDVKPVYFYENPARTNDSNRTFAVIKGRYAGHEDSYYKIDLGNIPANEIAAEVGYFEYYNLVRNFDYIINLNKVESDGYESLDAAANGSVYNNFSAAVEARSMASISDGNDMLYVNKTTFVFTFPNQVKKLKYKYLEDISTVKGGNLANEKISLKWEAGDFIKNVNPSPKGTTDPDDPDWYYADVTGPESPNKKLQQQTIYVYRGNKNTDASLAPDYGVYRVINFFSHEPWVFDHVETFPGLWENFDDMPSWSWGDSEKEIGQSKGSTLTLFFELPPDIPEALFPLEFVIESNRQNIQNAYQGNAVVQSVPYYESLFNDGVYEPTPTTSRIQYVKTVRWEEYNENPTLGSDKKGSRLVRCRFQTITDLNQEVVGDDSGTSETILRIYNENFGSLDQNGNWLQYVDEKFTRNTTTSDPTPRVWDFSQPVWDTRMLEMNERHDKILRFERDTYDLYRDDNNVTDGLIFVDGLEVKKNVKYVVTKTDGTKDEEGIIPQIDAPTLRNYTDNRGLRYVLAQNATGAMRGDDKLMTKLNYGINQARVIKLAVMSTMGSSTTTLEPEVIFTGRDASKLSLPSPQMDYSNVYPTYVYMITVPKEVEQFNIELKAPTGSSSIRFYRIDFYPRWDQSM